VGEEEYTVRKTLLSHNMHLRRTAGKLPCILPGAQFSQMPNEILLTKTFFKLSTEQFGERGALGGRGTSVNNLILH